MDKPDTIKVEIMRSAEIEADEAFLFVTIKGSSLLTGAAPLKKAREIGQLVRELMTGGVKEQDISVRGIQAQVSSGAIGSASSAAYSLRVRCRDLDRLADLLGTVTSQKNASLDSLAWVYGREQEVKDGLADECIAACNEKAARFAAGLGVRLLGVHSFSERRSAPLTRAYDVPEAKGPTRGRISKEDFGFDLSNSRKIEVAIEVEYRVGPFEPGGIE